MKLVAIISFVFGDFGSFEPFWTFIFDFFFHQIQSWTKIVGTLVHNWAVVKCSIPNPPPPFNVVLVWTQQANHITCDGWQHWFRGAGSVKCPSFNGQDCLRRVKKLPINLTKMLITFKQHMQMLWFFRANKRATLGVGNI